MRLGQRFLVQRSHIDKMRRLCNSRSAACESTKPQPKVSVALPASPSTTQYQIHPTFSSHPAALQRLKMHSWGTEWTPCLNCAVSNRARIKLAKCFGQLPSMQPRLTVPQRCQDKKLTWTGTNRMVGGQTDRLKEMIASLACRNIK